VDLDVPLGLRADPASRGRAVRLHQVFTIYDSGDSRALIKRLVKEHEADAFGCTPASVQGRISKLKNELRMPSRSPARRT
jgi:superfamily I DNA/RNA helicase